MLYETIERLFTPDSQRLLARLFGLHGETETPLEELAGGNYRTPRYRSIVVRKYQMLKALREALKTHYPTLAHRKISGKQKRAYHSVVLTGAQRSRLDQAYQELEAQREAITMRSMIRLSRLNNAYVLAYLAERKAQ